MTTPRNPCHALQCGDQMVCECGAVWDVSDRFPPECSGFYVTADSTSIHPVALRAILSDDFDMLGGSAE